MRISSLALSRVMALTAVVFAVAAGAAAVGTLTGSLESGTWLPIMTVLLVAMVNSLLISIVASRNITRRKPPPS